jgi:hypothetical protein
MNELIRQSKPMSIVTKTHNIILLLSRPSKRSVTFRFGHAIAQVVSHRLPTVAARVRSRVWSNGICGGKNGIGAGFLQELPFPLPIFIPPFAPQSPSPIIWGWYNRPQYKGLSYTLLALEKKLPSGFPTKILCAFLVFHTMLLQLQ